MNEIDTGDPKVRTGLFGLDSALLAAVLIYVTVVAAAYLRFGTLPQVSFGVVAVLVLPFIGLATGSKEFMRSSALIVAVLLTYESLQGINGALVNSGNAVSMAPLDQALVGSNFVAGVQTVFASSATTLVSTVFYGMHAFLIVIAFVLFWFTDRAVYRGYTYSLVLTSYLALLTFVILPTKPPWLAGTAQNLMQLGVNADEGHKPLILPRLLYKVACAAFDAFDGQIDVAPRGHHNHRQARVELLDARQQIKTLLAGGRVACVVQVDEQHIVIPLAERFQQKLG